MRGKRTPCAARPQEEGRYAVSKINRAVSMKREIEDSNIPAVKKRLKSLKMSYRNV